MADNAQFIDGELVTDINLAGKVIGSDFFLSSLLVHPVTGDPLEYDKPVETFEHDAEVVQVTVAVGATGDIGTYDLKGFKSVNIAIKSAGTFAINLTSSSDQSIWFPAAARKGNLASSGQTPKSTIDSIENYRHGRIHRFIKLSVAAPIVGAPLVFAIEKSIVPYSDFVITTGAAQAGNGVTAQAPVTMGAADRSSISQYVRSDSSGHLATTSANGAGTDRSLDLTANVSQQLVAENLGRRALIIQSDATDVTIKYGTAAAVVGAAKTQRVIKQNVSFSLAPSVIYTGPVQIISANTASVFAWEA